MNEIVVTARKRGEALSDVPLTITALSGDDIEERGIKNLEDISTFAPGFNYSKQGNQRGGRSESVIRFRGMDINDVAPTRQLASVFVDGIYVAGGLSSLSTEDVERVEVIKGPQSAHFGRSTFGGAVNFISKSPKAGFSASAMLQVAEGGYLEAVGSLEGSLGTDDLRARITGRTYSFNGRYRSVADNGRLGEEETGSVNLIVDADPTPGVRVRANVFFSQDEDGAPASFALTRDMHNCGPFYPGGVTYFCGNLPQVDNFGTNTVLNGEAYDIYVNNSRNSEGLKRGPSLDHVGLRRKIERYSLSSDIDIAPIDATLTVGGSYNKLKQNRILDLDFTPENVWLESSFQYIEDWSGEARLSGETGAINWLVGGSIFDLRYETPNGSIGYLFPNSTFPNGFFLDQKIGRTDVRTYAGFGSVAWSVTDNFTLNVEGRYQADKIDQGVVAGVNLAKTFKNFLPRVILQWQPDRDTNLYLTYAKGNKPGDFNTSVVGLTQSQKDEVLAQTGATDIVGEEELDNYEIGLKKSFANGLFNINLAAYYMQWKNQQNRTQATITDPNTPAGIRLVPVIVSAGKTDLWGIEAEASARVTDDITLSGTFNWAASEYKVFDCGFCARLTGNADVSGNSSPRFPEFSGTLSAAYNRELNSGLGVFGRLDGVYSGSAYTEAFNLAKKPSSIRVNARAGIERDWWRAELFVNNLLDDDTYLSAARFTDFTKGNFNLRDFVANVTPADPRQFGIRLRFTY
ncbi:TonB-dependent receptor [Parasphingorhabdus sp. JC815]|uniref:TonB-dependent receptor n=1 Tax=Parasphingorhabdus sp. JC815 TaxID=3232140 RepID=UPI0034585D9C